MASLRGYATATQVRQALAGNVAGYWTDTNLEDMINRMEGVVDSYFGAGNTITYSASKAMHQVINGAVVYGAALSAAGPSAASWNTLDQLINAQNTFAYMLKFYMDIVQSDFFGDRVLEA